MPCSFQLPGWRFSLPLLSGLFLLLTFAMDGVILPSSLACPPTSNRFYLSCKWTVRWAKIHVFACIDSCKSSMEFMAFNYSLWNVTFLSISQFLLASMQATVLSGVYSAVPSFVMIFVIPLSGQVADLMRSTRYFSTTFVRKIFGAAGTAWFFYGAFALVFPNSSVACPHWHHMAMVTMQVLTLSNCLH